jgi:hypothetical protein
LLRRDVLLCDDHVDVELLFARDGLLHLRASIIVFANQLAEHHVAHGEAERRHRSSAISQVADEIVVTPTPSDRSEFLRAIEYLEDNAGVVGEAAHDTRINLKISFQAAAAQIVGNLLELD